MFYNGHSLRKIQNFLLEKVIKGFEQPIIKQFTFYSGSKNSEKNKLLFLQGKQIEVKRFKFEIWYQYPTHATTLQSHIHCLTDAQK